ncbi:MAG: uroporphyrinogen-III C-methyltransferase [Candidatus Binataceae bacterium]
MNSNGTVAGKVYLVGAGPGADDLITMRGLAVLSRADVVLYDALLSPKLLAQAPEAAERLFVGKRCGRHEMEQPEICRIIVERAREGKIVVRLKGGDPMIYGHGGEEALACKDAGLAFEVIPGICSALGAASYAGIPLTHRGMASSVAFVTAHGFAAPTLEGPKWEHLAKAVDTLVIFMGGAKLEGIARSLMEFGRAAETPVAVISNATCETQRTILGTLADIADQASRARLSTPALIIVGEVSSFTTLLNWFECEPQARAAPTRAPDRFERS